jgi:integrase
MAWRRFGRVRKLPSGRFRARYLGPDGVDRPAPNTFPTKKDADVWLARTEAAILEGRWVDPSAPALEPVDEDPARITVAEYADQWIRERDLADSTATKYREYLDRFVRPTLGATELRDLTPAGIRTWFTQLKTDGVTEMYRAKTYRFLRAVMNTAADDELVGRNPCRIKGAGQEYSPERPVLEVADVLRVASAIQPRYRLLILLAAFTELRYSELMRLVRADIDLVDGVVSVRPSDHRGKSKSKAGVRKVAIPTAIMPAVDFHMKVYAEPDNVGRVFVGPRGATPSVANFNGVWHKALIRAGLPRMHFHDLRHSGNNAIAESGASTKELMRRMGHSSSRAALIYQHATDKRDRVLAESLSAMIEQARSGT